MHSYQSVGRGPFRATAPPPRYRTVAPTTAPRARVAASEYVQPLLRAPNPQLALRVPAPALGAGPFRAANSAHPGETAARRVHHPHSEAEEAQDSRRSRKRSSSTRARAFPPRSSNTIPPRSSMRCARHVDSWRALPNPSQWQVTPETARLLSTGGTTSSAASAPSSARSKPLKPPSG